MIAEASYVGRGCEGEHLAVTRVDHHDRASTVAQRSDGGALQVPRHRKVEVLRVVRVRPELAQRIRERVAGKACQLGVVGKLQPRPAIPGRGVPDDVADLGSAVAPVQLPVGVLLVVGQHVALAIDDRAARHGPAGGDDRWVVRRPGQLRRADDRPVTAGAGQDAERQREHDGHVDDRPSEGSAAGRRRQHQATRRRRRRSRQRRTPAGGGGGSTPLSDNASRSPTTMAFTTSDDPP